MAGACRRRVARAAARPRCARSGLRRHDRSCGSQYGRRRTSGRTLVPTSRSPDVPGVSSASVPPEKGTRTMSLKSKTMKTLAVVTAAGALTVGGASAAMAADGSGSSTSGGAATATQRLHDHPGVRQALRTAFGAAADALGTTGKDLRAHLVQGHQSLASVAGDQSGQVASAMVASLGSSIDQAVANGHFPAERVEKAKSRLPQIVERLMNRVPGQNAQQ